MQAVQGVWGKQDASGHISWALIDCRPCPSVTSFTSCVLCRPHLPAHAHGLRTLAGTRLAIDGTHGWVVRCEIARIRTARRYAAHRHEFAIVQTAREIGRGRGT